MQKRVAQAKACCPRAHAVIGMRQKELSRRLESSEVESLLAKKALRYLVGGLRMTKKMTPKKFGTALRATLWGRGCSKGRGLRDPSFPSSRAFQKA